MTQHDIDQLPFKKLDDRAVLPARGSEHAAALDLSAIESVALPPGKRAGVKTGLAVEIPQGYYGRVAPRSGLAIKQGINVLGGVVDSDYRGELIVLLINHGEETFEINPGDRIAQFVIEAMITPQPVLVDELSDTIRNEGGFGSTNI